MTVAPGRGRTALIHRQHTTEFRAMQMGRLTLTLYLLDLPTTCTH